jgi:hypothetical protein
MTGQAGAHTNWPELVAIHGYDAKYAMHALRLAARHRASDQRMHHAAHTRTTPRVPALDRSGGIRLAEVVDAVSDAETRLTELRDSSAVPDQPDRRWSMNGCIAAT